MGSSGQIKFLAAGLDDGGEAVVEDDRMEEGEQEDDEEEEEDLDLNVVKSAANSLNAGNVPPELTFTSPPPTINPATNTSSPVDELLKLVKSLQGQLAAKESTEETRAAAVAAQLAAQFVKSTEQLAATNVVGTDGDVGKTTRKAAAKSTTKAKEGGIVKYLINPGRQQRLAEKEKEERLSEVVEAEKEKPRETTAAEAALEAAHLFESTPSETEAVELLMRNRDTAMGDGSNSEEEEDDDGDVTLQGSPPN
jgi:hypothetical protein